MLELMSPSLDHERLKSTIGCLIEAYALKQGIEFTAYGSWTLKRRGKQAGAEPDECYVIGLEPRKRVPDLAIEVVWTSGGLDKLEIYRRLGVAEVVVWQRGRIEVHALGAEGYQPVQRSRFFPGLDFALLATFLDRPTTSQAVCAFGEALRKRRPAIRRARR
jgi:Uma2 family endonuclease